MPWTQFMDMHSGGGTKVKGFDYIYIEAPLDKAVAIFERMFHRNPYNVTCECCGEDYSLTEGDSLEQATAYNRDCVWNSKTRRYDEKVNLYGTYVPLDTYLKRKDIKVVRQP